jgi:hypothetical protein
MRSGARKKGRVHVADWGCEVRLTDYLKEVGRHISYYPSLAKILGVNETIFICHIFFWSNKGRDGEGWIYKTLPELEDETGLSSRQLLRVRHNLVSAGIIKEKRGRNKIHINVVTDKLNDAWDRKSPIEYPPTEEVSRLRDKNEKQRIVSSQNGSRNDESSVAKRRIVSCEMTNRQFSEGLPNICTEEEQKKNRRGSPPREKEEGEEKSNSGGKKRKTEGPFFNEFKTAWMLAFKERFGFEYGFSGRDGKAIAILQGQSLPAEELLSCAQKAWEHPKPFIADCSRTLPSLANNIVAIRLAVQSSSTPNFNKFGMPE